MSTRNDAPLLPWYYSIPLFGWIARDLVHGSRDNIVYFLIMVLTALVLAVKTWGLVALTLTAVACVPVCFALLILISVGK